jgi:adenine/guanine phosphoribosyltransferase-like PRPP-binding protein
MFKDSSFINNAEQEKVPWSSGCGCQIKGSIKVGVESRGFFLWHCASSGIECGFYIPVRKPNKLPYETISATYDLEYGTDTLKYMLMQFKRRPNPIHDDVLATGGTAQRYVNYRTTR